MALEKERYRNDNLSSCLMAEYPSMKLIFITQTDRHLKT